MVRHGTLFWFFPKSKGRNDGWRTSLVLLDEEVIESVATSTAKPTCRPENGEEMRRINIKPQCYKFLLPNSRSILILWEGRFLSRKTCTSCRGKV